MTRTDPTRRRLIAGIAAALVAPGCTTPFGPAAHNAPTAPVASAGSAPPAAAAPNRLILLGTKGGPRVGNGRSNPASALVLDGVPYVIDCGNGVARQLVQADIPLNAVRHVFITHLHSDHMLDYGGLLYDAWAAGLRHPVDAYGPPTLDELTRDFFDYMRFDIDTRIADEGRPDLRKLVRTHPIGRDAVVMENDRVKVTAARNVHPPIHESYALRFDTRERSIVFSGDTNRSDAVVALAQGADLLVHEALYVPGVEAMLARVPNAATLKEHLLASHTTTEDVGRVAAAARVKKLVLTHLVPGDDPGITDAMWLEGVRRHYDGEVVVGRDLMVL